AHEERAGGYDEERVGVRERPAVGDEVPDGERGGREPEEAQTEAEREAEPLRAGDGEGALERRLAGSGNSHARGRTASGSHPSPRPVCLRRRQACADT